MRNAVCSFSIKTCCPQGGGTAEIKNLVSTGSVNRYCSGIIAYNIIMRAVLGFLLMHLLAKNKKGMHCYLIIL